MANDIFAKWNKQVDTEGLKKDIKDAADNKQTFEEVPVGTYEVAVVKMELKASKKGDPMLAIQFKIVSSNCKGRLIFFNQVLTTGFGIHTANEFMRSLDSGVAIEFEDYAQYNELVQNVFEAINEKLEYGLDYGKNDKGFNTYKITEVFED